MGNDYLGMGPQAGLYAACLPLPKHNITLSIATADPLAVGRKSHLACVTRDRVSGEPLISCLPEIICAVNQDLIVQGLGCKVLLWISEISEVKCPLDSLEFRSITYCWDAKLQQALNACVVQQYT